ncbi:hypothetical protein QVL76_24185, partial [Klebsiella pneumoniae]|nr:hypothetical protein [Klebsiella pneumoniae]
RLTLVPARGVNTLSGPRFVAPVSAARPGTLPQQRSAKSLLAQLSEQEEDILACAEANDKKYRY